MFTAAASRLEEAEYRLIWDRFYSAFNFRPNYYDRVTPAIDEPSPSVVFDLSDALTGDLFDAIDAFVLDAFRSLVEPTQFAYWLDWQHECYRFDPHAADLTHVPWFPDGDYHILLAPDLSFGTFGHPWQLSLCVFGAELINELPQGLLESLPILRQSPRPLDSS